MKKLIAIAGFLSFALMTVTLVEAKPPQPKGYVPGNQFAPEASAFVKASTDVFVLNVINDMPYAFVVAQTQNFNRFAEAVSTQTTFDLGILEGYPKPENYGAVDNRDVNGVLNLQRKKELPERQV